MYFCESPTSDFSNNRQNLLKNAKKQAVREIGSTEKLNVTEKATQMHRKSRD